MKSQLVVIFLVSIVSLVGTVFVTTYQPSIFIPYTGAFPPILAMLMISVLGVSVLYFMNRRYQFEIFDKRTFKRGLCTLSLLVLPFMVLVTLADIYIGFPQAINVDYPLSIMFYPAIGYAAQIVLHIVPFAVILTVIKGIARFYSFNNKIWIAILLTSLIEAIYQLNSDSNALNIFVAIHLFLFGAAELFLYHRYDYLTMYLFRIVYYSYWHVLWGNLRLTLLF